MKKKNWFQKNYFWLLVVAFFGLIVVAGSNIIDYADELENEDDSSANPIWGHELVEFKEFD